MKKGSKHTEETRRKLSEASKKNPIRYWLGKKGHSLSKEARETISKKLKGRRLSDETKWKIAQTKIGRRGFKHSEGSRRKMSASQPKGERNHLWRGGVSKENNKIRHSIEFRLWRDAIFARDNWTCQKTGIRGRELHAHHILNFSEYPKLRFDINNGITLSEKAHKEFHKKYGNKNNTKEQMDEFLLSTQ